jgi:predicted metalloprotease with PDZ domain
MKLRLDLAAAALLLLAAAPAPQPLRYLVTPVLKAGALDSLQIELRLKGDADGTTLVRLPDEYGGETELWKETRDFQVTGGAVRETAPGERLITHKPGARLVVRYHLVSAYAKDPKVGEAEHTYRPVIRPSWFSVLGYAAFSDVEGRSRAPTEVRFGPLPKGWKAASSAAPVGPRLPTLDEARRSVMLGGPGLRVMDLTAAGGPLRIAALGRWDMDLGAFSKVLGQVMGAERAYWNDRGGHYFVALTPLEPTPQSYSYGGSGLADAFTIYAGTDTKLADLRWLLAHEHLHGWNPTRLGGLADGPEEAAGYWFSEGFTDFLTDRILLRSGVWSLEDFVTALNGSLKEYAVSPARTAPNARIATDFWKDRAVQRMPYVRGLLLAFVWDHDLAKRAPGKDLDDVLLLQQARAAKEPGMHAPVLFPRVYAEAGGRDLGEDLRRYVEGGEAILLPADLFGDCARVITENLPAFDRGFDPAATVKNNYVVTGVDPDGPAYAAGMRNGMILKEKLSGQVGDTGIDYAYRLEDGGKPLEVRYRPVGRRTYVQQQVELAAGLSPERRAACVRRMSGL